MDKIEITEIIIAAIMLYFPIEYYFFWLPKHKRSMKKFKDSLEESKRRRENAHKTASHD